MFCSALYNHTNIRGGNRIYPCCRYKTPIQKFDGDVGNILHSEEYKKLRKDMESDWLPGCGKCKHEEDLGVESFREKFNSTYDSETPELKYLEVGFDNICDLTCDGCYEEWSSSWWAKKNPTLPAKQGITSTEEFKNIPNSVNRVKFLGGEPLMTNRHRRFLQSLDSLESLTVEYFTNGMHQLQDIDIDLLTKCKQVHFTVSIDAVGTLNDKVRSGSVWSNVVDTLNQIAGKFDYRIHTTVHKNNWHGLPDMHHFAKAYKKWTIGVLTFPRGMDIVNLDQADKSKFLDILEELDIPNSHYIKSHLQGTT